MLAAQRRAPEPFFLSRASCGREGPALVADGRFVHGDLWTMREALECQRALSLVVATCQRPGFLRCLPGSVSLAGGLGRVLSAPGSRSGAVEGGRRRGGVGVHFRGVTGLLAEYPYLLVGWLWYLGMLVPVIGLVQVGSQATADRFTYLPQIGLYIALAWGVTDACRSLAVSSLAVRRHVGTGAGGSDGLCVASDIVVARQRDPLDPRPGLHFAEQCSPQQPRQRPGRPRTG